MTERLIEEIELLKAEVETEKLRAFEAEKSLAGVREKLRYEKLKAESLLGHVMWCHAQHRSFDSLCVCWACSGLTPETAPIGW